MKFIKYTSLLFVLSIGISSQPSAAPFENEEFGLSITQQQFGQLQRIMLDQDISNTTKSSKLHTDLKIMFPEVDLPKSIIFGGLRSENPDLSEILKRLNISLESPRPSSSHSASTSLIFSPTDTEEEEAQALPAPKKSHKKSSKKPAPIHEEDPIDFANIPTWTNDMPAPIASSVRPPKREEVPIITWTNSSLHQPLLTKAPPPRKDPVFVAPAFPSMAISANTTRAGQRVSAAAWDDQDELESALKSGNEALTVSQKKELLQLKARAAQGGFRTSDFLDTENPYTEENLNIKRVINTMGDKGAKNDDIVIALLEKGYRPKFKK